MNIISFYDICRPGYNGDTAVCDCDGDLSCIVAGVLSLHDMHTEPLSSGIVRLGWLGSCPLGGTKTDCVREPNFFVAFFRYSRVIVWPGGWPL